MIVCPIYSMKLCTICTSVSYQFMENIEYQVKDIYIKFLMALASFFSLLMQVLALKCKSAFMGGFPCGRVWQ